MVQSVLGHNPQFPDLRERWLVDGDVGPARSDDGVAVNGDTIYPFGRSSGGTTGVPPASRHTRTLPS